MPASLISEMPSACRVCGGRSGGMSPDTGHWVCRRCGWRLGDAFDADLPRPVVAVVYYLRFGARVKIGTSERPRQRLAAIRHDELLAFERGGRSLEQQRHREFAALREGGEWFTLVSPLTEHIETVRATASDPWLAYDRWLGDAYRRASS
ncbi:GIY-YIG nuclease family protein [Microbacterium arborescens]|nr:GIY-YIG nuclease family protein [Microbacterium arborescens]